MPFQIASQHINTTFDATSKSVMVNALKNALVTVGWSVAASGIDDFTLQSQTTVVGSLKTKVRIYDPGAFNCMRIQFRNQPETLLGREYFILPNRIYPPIMRIIANEYQFFTMYPGSSSVNRSFACGGVPFLEDFLDGVITDCIWSNGDSDNSDTSTTLNVSFRTRPTIRSASQYGNGNWATVNGNVIMGVGLGTQHLLLPYPGAEPVYTGQIPFLWHRGEAFKIPARIAFGNTSDSVVARIQGQLWDAAIISVDQPPDITAQFDGYTWYNVMDFNSSLGAPSVSPKASLWIVVPDEP